MYATLQFCCYQTVPLLRLSLAYLQLLRQELWDGEELQLMLLYLRHKARRRHTIE